MYSKGWKAMDHGIVRFLAISALISRCHGIGSIIPSNASIPVNDLHATSTSVMLGITQGYSQTQYALLEVLHLNATDAKIPVYGITAPLFLSTPQNQSQESIQTISFISCDPSDYVGSIGSLNIGPSDIADAVEKENTANAVIFYSQNANFCIPQSSMSIMWPYVFTMQSAKDSTTIISHIKKAGNTPFNASLAPITIPSNATDKASGSNDQPPVQGTAVAMIVLYAITGLVTSLFIFIIITGAIKARRHPERYGPRTQPGRRRQTRAGGLARAILETIPVVKFGEPDAKTSDVELTAPSVSNINQASTINDKPTSKVDVTTSHVVSTPTIEEEEGISAAGPVKTESDKEKDENHGCSICTDDFEVGQDQRILPCGHAFHPACIDPWLLNVSGTCPLCRVDLRPRQSVDVGNRGSDDGNASPPDLPISEETSQRHEGRRRSFLAFTGLARADRMSPAERAAALRRYRL